ncbi:MAG: hypothetical protein RH949_32255 [Coleofasciculus sp. A1-SPW-01]|uniref:DUF6884 domain-containing protein n=1 Tax=Coleofasciculus sp. A1-SPW-01 TaxID=3070819 RepID=UPI0032FC0C56
MNTPRFFAAFGKGDFIKYQGKRLGFWDVIGSGITPYGYIYSLAYQHAVFPDPTIPLFGDCGAWTYRKQDTPTLFQDIVDAQWAIRSYQKRLHPNQETYVTAPDHILFANLSRCQREARREFNWINAHNFFKLAKTQLPHTTPVAVAHGLSISERIRAALDLVELGYKLIGLGGLATIGNVSHALTIIQTVANQLPRSTSLHIFGLCAPRYAKAFAQLPRVYSFDGSTHIREAFQGNFLQTVEDKLVRHRTEKERITIPLCHCYPCRHLKKLGIEPRCCNTRPNNLGRVVHNLKSLVTAQRNAQTNRQILLIAGVAKKLNYKAPAIELYCSPLFKATRRYADATANEFYLLSALHGVVHPQQILEPYECNPYKLSPFQRRAWCNKVINQLRAIAPLGAEFVILGGRQYYAGIIEPLEAAQLYTVTTPLAGLAIGRKLHWLKVNTPSFRQLSLGL